MNALVFDRFGEPADVLAPRDVPAPQPGRGEVRVRMIASPINPSDLLVVRGRYGVLPALPATPGFEGVGIVDKLGPGLNLLGRHVMGKRVCVINSAGGNWAEYAVIPARQARPVPADIPDEQVATFFVNPATVLAMVRHVLRVPAGEWLVQSAAASELGRMIIRLGRRDGFKTLNIVRNPAAVEPLKALGADVVICAEDHTLSDQILKHTGPAGVRYALDPVGGDTGSAIVQSLGDRGHMLVYGSLSEQPIAVPSRQLIAKRCRLEGFWLGHFMRGLSIPASLAMFGQIAKLIRDGTLASTIGPTFKPSDIQQATAAAEQPGRHGKVLLRFTT